MDMDNLWKAIVPLAFLAIWALTALFNRDAKPLPNRVQGPQSPYGPRPQPPARPAPERPPTLRWSPQGTSATTRPGGDDDIVILDGPRQVRPAPSRVVGATRRRAKPAAPAKPPATSAPTALSASTISQTVNQQLTLPMIEPLSAPLTTSQSIPDVRASAPKGEQGDAFRRSISVGILINSPEKIREAILVNEILMPPLALRGRNRRG